jgi:uncharacterized protein YfdQ (DUF2303 family)
MFAELVKFLKSSAVTPLGNLPAFAMPTDMAIRPTFHLMDDAPRKTGIVHVESLDAFIDYIDRHHTNESAIFASSKDNAIKAVMDWHQSDGEEFGGFARHQVILPFVFTDRWQAWTAISGKPMHQKTLAEHIEEYLGDIVAPDAAAVLETVLTLSGKKSVAYKNATRLASGDVAIQWEETTEAKAGQSGELKVPSEITLRLPVYVGCEDETTFDVRTMFRFHVHEGSLTFTLKMLGIERIRELAFAAIYSSLVANLESVSIKTPVYRGTIVKTPLQTYAQ